MSPSGTLDKSEIYCSPNITPNPAKREIEDPRLALIFVDGRSAGSPRISGWERYARSICKVLIDNPRVVIGTGYASQSTLNRIYSDWVTLPSLQNRFAASHYLTFPPSPRASRKNTIVTVHDLTWWKYPKTASLGGRLYYSRLARKAIEAATIVVTVSESVAGELRSEFGLRNVSVVSPSLGSGFREGQASPALDTPDDPYLLALGSIEPRKNLARLVEAFELVESEGSPLKLVIAGRQAWGNVPTGVRVVDSPTDSDLLRLIRGSAGLVLPSIYEGFGLPIIEAQAMRKPIFCSDIPVFHEVSGENAVFFDPLDKESIADCLTQWENPKVDIDLAQTNALKFTPDRTASQLDQVYSRVGVSLSDRLQSEVG